MNSTSLISQLLFNQMNNPSQNINYPQNKNTTPNQNNLLKIIQMLELKKNLNSLNPSENINNYFPQNNPQFFPINRPFFSNNQTINEEFSNSENSDSEDSDESNNFSNSNQENNESDNTKENSEKSLNIKKNKNTMDFKKKWKTEKCHYWEMYGECKFGANCAFAHGEKELKKKTNINSNYKTKPCKQFFEEGYCSYGTRCQFSHKKEDYNEFHHIEPKKKIVYNKIMSDLLNNGQADINAIIRPRLNVFEKIVTCSLNDTIKNRLLFSQDVIDLKNLIVNKNVVYQNFLRK